MLGLGCNGAGEYWSARRPSTRHFLIRAGSFQIAKPAVMFPSCFDPLK